MSAKKSLRAALTSTVVVTAAAVSALALASPASAYSVARGDRRPGAVTQKADTPFMTAYVDAQGNAHFRGPDLTLGPTSGDGYGYVVAPGTVETIEVTSTLQEQTAQGWEPRASTTQDLSVTADGAPVELSPSDFPAPPKEYGGRTFRIYVAMAWTDDGYYLGTRDVIPDSTNYYDVRCDTHGVKACSVMHGALNVSL